MNMSVLSKLFKPFTRYHGNDIRPDEWTNELGGRTAQKHKPLPTLSGGNGI